MNGQIKKIMVVEDEWMIGEYIADFLIDAGHEVLGPLPNVAQALAVLDRVDHNIDVALLDISLGKEKSFSIVKWVRGRLVRECRANRLSPNDPLQAHRPHKPGDSAAGDIEAFTLQLPPDFPDAIDAEVHTRNYTNLTDAAATPPAIQNHFGRKGDHEASRIGNIRGLCGRR